MLEETYTQAAPSGLRVVSCQAIEAPYEAPLRLNHPDRHIRVVIQPTVEMATGWYELELLFPPEGIVDLVVNISLGKADQFWLRPSALDRNHFAVNLRVANPVMEITLLVGGSGEVRRPVRFSFGRINGAAWLLSHSGRALRILQREPLRFVRSAVFTLGGLARLRQWGPGHLGMLVTPRGSPAPVGEVPYDTWIRIFDENPTHHRQRHEERMARLARWPLFSCISYISEPAADAIKRLVHDLTQQIYPHWQLLIAVPAPVLSPIQAELKTADIDPHFVTIIPAARNAASTFNALIAEATGEFVIKIAHGAILRSHALLELALVLDRYPDAEIIYSDEDAIDQNGRRSGPKFKPAWSPDYLVASDYMGDISLLRRHTIRQVGGWRSYPDGTWDHDLKLRITERVAARQIIHLAKVLVHVPFAPKLATADVRSLRDRVAPLCRHARVETSTADLPRFRYLNGEPPSLISLIIPTRDRADLLELCVRSILQRTAYKSFEIIIVDNDSKEIATSRLFRTLQQESHVRILHSPGSFNFSALNNLAAREARGTLLGLINNDIEVIDGKWLDEMAGLAERPDVGCVGAKLLFPDGRIQHAGVTIGLWGVAGHGHRLLPRDAAGYLNQMHYTHEVDAVTAACLVVRKSVYVEVGGFDEKELKVEFNDVDFCLKVRSAGYRNLWTPFAELIHHESASRGSYYTRAKARRSVIEANVIRRRWGQRLFNDPYYSPNLTLDRPDFSVRVQ